MMVQMAASNTILQTIADDDKRGRVMSFCSMAFLGIAPFGSIFAGVLAGAIGAGNTVLLGGVAFSGRVRVRGASALVPDAHTSHLRRTGDCAGDCLRHPVGDVIHATPQRSTDVQ